MILSIFSVEGKALPSDHFVTIFPRVIKELQEAGAEKKFSFDKNRTKLKSDKKLVFDDFKQTPPDWFVRKKCEED